MSSQPELPKDIREPRDLTPRIRADGRASAHTPAGPAQPIDSTRGDWDRVHALARAFSAAEECCRLYPSGHQRIRHALKHTLQLLQDYSTGTGRAFTFVPDAALDLTTSEKTRAARDIEAFAYVCRTHRIEQLTIDPDVSVDELESLSRLLIARADQSTDAAVDENERPDPSAWTRIHVRLYESDDADDGYRFNAKGDQIFPASSGSVGEGTVLPDNLPPTLRKSLTRVFADPSVCSSLEDLGGRLGLGAATTPGVAARGAEGRVDLVREIATHLFGDPATHIDTPIESLTRKVRDFVRFLEGVAPSLADSGADSRPQLSEEEIRQLLQKAAGVERSGQRGLPEIFTQSAKLQSFFIRKPERTTSLPEEVEPSHQPEPEPAAQPTTRSASKELEGAGPSPREHPSQDHGGDGDTLRPFVEILAIEADEPRLAKNLELFDYDLEATRINVELMARETDAGSYDKKRKLFLDAMASREWQSVDHCLSELDTAVDTLCDQPLDDIERLIGDTLCRHPSQAVVDGFFSRRIDSGADLEALRPLLVRLSESDVSRSVHVLGSLWKDTSKASRARFVDEIFFLGLDEVNLASWATSHIQVFTGERALSHVRRMAPLKLRRFLERLLDWTKENRPGAAEASAAVLRAARTTSTGEGLCTLALRHGNAVLRTEALNALDTCTSDETVKSLERILDRENTAREPDLDEVRLALTALIRSPRARAAVFIDRVEGERKMLRHTYGREIREILDILWKVERRRP